MSDPDDDFPSAEAGDGERWKHVYRDPAAAARYAEKRAKSKTSARREAVEARVVARALDRAGARASGLALDCPSGTGRFTTLLEARGFRVVAADIALPMLARVERGARVVADAERLPFAARAFDVVLCVRLLHHIAAVDARRRVLAELARVARGPIVVSFFHTISWGEARDRLTALVRPFDKSRHTLTLGALRAEARDVGLELEASYPLLRYVKRQWFAVLRART